ncbi:hypothetical protein [Maribellus sediminis]|uniref:hypothetical protein n=1 Tax=Maribellus sediminis TaxID=2696285 RepID=UPI0014302230|nr:hypothetical protein [Maribellus sediminis]
MEKLSWTKEIFGSKLEISQGNEKIGSINWESMVSSKAQAIINGRLFTLNREFFLSKLEIYDSNGQSLLGTIMINFLNPRSDILINGKRFELEIKNFWQSKWSWKFDGVDIITYTSHEFITKDKGTIDLATPITDEVEILILLGLFVRNQFILLMLLALLVVLVVII